MHFVGDELNVFAFSRSAHVCFVFLVSFSLQKYQCSEMALDAHQTIWLFVVVVVVLVLPSAEKAWISH